MDTEKNELLEKLDKIFLKYRNAETFYELSRYSTELERKAYFLLTEMRSENAKIKNLIEELPVLDKKKVNDLAYQYLDREQTEGQTTKSEKSHFVQGFMQACTMCANDLVIIQETIY